MSSLSPNLETRIHFVFSITISNNSAINYIEIIVLNSWIDTQTQIRMGVSSIKFNTRGLGGVIYMSSLCQNHKYVNFIQLLFATTLSLIFS